MIYDNVPALSPDRQSMSSISDASPATIKPSPKSRFSSKFIKAFKLPKSKSKPVIQVPSTPSPAPSYTSNGTNHGTSNGTVSRSGQSFDSLPAHRSDSFSSRIEIDSISPFQGHQEQPMGLLPGFTEHTHSRKNWSLASGGINATKPVPLRTQPMQASSDIRVCGFCDMQITNLLSEERIINVQCTHSVHYECLHELMRITSLTSGGIVWPPCGICDTECIPVEHNVVQELNKEVYELVDRLGRLNGPKTSADTADNVHQQTFIIEDIITNDTSSLKQVKGELIQSYKIHTKSDNSSNPIKVLSQSAIFETNPETNTTTIQCLVNVSVPTNFVYCYRYLHTAEDVKAAKQMAQRVSGYKFKGVKLDTLKLGGLRLVSTLSVSADMANWKRSECMLFKHFMVISRDQSSLPVIKATVDLNVHLDGVEIISYDSGVALKLVLNAPALSTLYLTGSKELLHTWCAALQNPILEFPIGKPQRVPGLNESFISRAPLSLVLCIPAPTSTSQSHFIFEVMEEIRCRLAAFDQIGLVVYNGKSMNSVKLCRACDEQGGDKFKAALELAGNDPTIRLDIERLYTEMIEILTDFNAEKSTASAIIISDTENIDAQNIPSVFVQAHVPINTIGIGERHGGVALRNIANYTDGMYCSSKTYGDLKAIAVNVLEHETRYSHKDVSITLKTEANITVKDITGWPKTMSRYNKGASAHAPVLQSDSQAKVNIGSLAQGDFRSFLVEVELENTCDIENDVIDLLNLDISAQPVIGAQFERSLETAKVSVKRKDLLAEHKQIPAFIFQRMVSLQVAEILEDILELARQYELGNACRAIDQRRKDLKTLFELMNTTEQGKQKIILFADHLYNIYEGLLRGLRTIVGRMVPLGVEEINIIICAVAIIRNEASFSRGTPIETLYSEGYDNERQFLS